jgi:hypothetical protein
MLLPLGGIVVRQRGHVGSDIENELVTVYWQDRYRQPHRRVILVKGDTGVNENGGVVADPEEGLFLETVTTSTLGTEVVEVGRSAAPATGTWYLPVAGAACCRRCPM